MGGRDTVSLGILVRHGIWKIVGHWEVSKTTVGSGPSRVGCSGKAMKAAFPSQLPWDRGGEWQELGGNKGSRKKILFLEERSVYLDARGCHGEEEEKKDSEEGRWGRNQQNW